MDLPTTIETFKERLKEEHIHFKIPDFKEGILYIRNPANDTYILGIETYNYQDRFCERDDSTNIYRVYSENLEACLDRNIFRDNGRLRYSRITDTVHLTDEDLHKKERYKLAEYFFMKKSVENCCACMEPNTVLTLCGHNLCRYCAKGLGRKFKCPICRRKLNGCTCDVNNEDHEDYDMEEDEDL